MYLEITILILTVAASVFGILQRVYKLTFKNQWPFFIARKNQEKLSTFEWALVFIATVTCLFGIFIQIGNKAKADKEKKTADSLKDVVKAFQDSTLKLNRLNTVLGQTNLGLSQKNYDHSTHIKDSLQKELVTVRNQNDVLQNQVLEAKKKISYDIFSSKKVLVDIAAEKALKASNQLQATTKQLSTLISGSDSPPVLMLTSNLEKTGYVAFISNYSNLNMYNGSYTIFNYDQYILCPIKDYGNGYVFTEKTCHERNILMDGFELLHPHTKFYIELPNFTLHENQGRLIMVSRISGKIYIEELAYKFENSTVSIGYKIYEWCQNHMVFFSKSPYIPFTDQEWENYFKLTSQIKEALK